MLADLKSVMPYFAPSTDLSFRMGRRMQKKEYAEATTRFRALLDRRPNHYSALSKLIQLLFRAGQSVPKSNKRESRRRACMHTE